MTMLWSKMFLSVVIACLVVICFIAIPAMAQENSSNIAEQGMNLGDNLGSLFVTFTITWGVFFVYLYYLSQKQKSIREDLENLGKSE